MKMENSFPKLSLEDLSFLQQLTSCFQVVSALRACPSELLKLLWQLVSNMLRADLRLVLLANRTLRLCLISFSKGLFCHCWQGRMQLILDSITLKTDGQINLKMDRIMLKSWRCVASLNLWHHGILAIWFLWFERDVEVRATFPATDLELSSVWLTQLSVLKEITVFLCKKSILSLSLSLHECH